MVSEKYTDYIGACNPLYTRDGTTSGLCNDDQGWTDGWDNDTICFAGEGKPTLIAIGATPDGGCGWLFGSIHPQMQAVFCDGSVHNVSYTINNNVWLYLCRINDGQEVGVLDD